MHVISAILDGTKVTYKAIEGVRSGTRAYTLCTQAKPLKPLEKVQVAADVAFAFFQAADLTLSGLNHFAPGFTANLAGSADRLHYLRSGLNAASGITHTVTISVEAMTKPFGIENAATIAGFVAFRGTDFFNLIADRRPLDPLETCIQAALGIAVCSVQIVEVSGRIIPKVRHILNSQSIPSTENPSCTKETRFPFTAAALRDIRNTSRTLPIYVPPSNIHNPEELEKACKDNFEKALDELKNWESWTEVPDWLASDYALKSVLCNITKRPAINPCNPKNTYGTRYEQQKFMELFGSENPVPPPGWPKDLPLAPDNVEEDLMGQKIVRDRLEALIKEYEEILTPPNS